MPSRAVAAYFALAGFWAATPSGRARPRRTKIDPVMANNGSDLVEVDTTI
jgi:hypothetical protein